MDPHQKISQISDEELISKITLVKNIAYKIAKRLPSNIDSGDLVSEGKIGLLIAAKKYDPSYGTKFITYAYIKIKGQILDYVRYNAFLPRGMNDRKKILLKEKLSLEKKLNKIFSENEIANMIGFSSKQLKNLNMCINFNNQIPLEQINEDGNYYPLPIEDKQESNKALNNLFKKENYNLLKTNIEKLKPKERVVIDLYYWQEKNFKEIGQILGYCESRICQLHKASINKLKKLNNIYMN